MFRLRRHKRVGTQIRNSEHRLDSENTCHPTPKSSNIRLLTVNCFGIRTNRSEFLAAVDYIKPYLICGTESWLKGIKPGSDPDKNAIKNCEIFPDHLHVHRNDRTTGIGGGVFNAVKDTLITDAQPHLCYDSEIVWSKVRLRNDKHLYLCSFYMPHRYMSDIRKLDESLSSLSNTVKDKLIVVAGDFNCPDINWDTLSVNSGASDREVQQALINISINHGLTQIHNQPTRGNNMRTRTITHSSNLQT